jgi:hypothetical protein
LANEAAAGSEIAKVARQTLDQEIELQKLCAYLRNALYRG